MYYVLHGTSLLLQGISTSPQNLPQDLHSARARLRLAEGDAHPMAFFALAFPPPSPQGQVGSPRPRGGAGLEPGSLGALEGASNTVGPS